MNLAFTVVDPVLSSGVKFGTGGAAASAFMFWISTAASRYNQEIQT